MKNMGQTEKIIRASIGVVIIGLGFYYKSWWGALGLVLIASAATGVCFLKALLGKTCCHSEKKQESSHGDHHDHSSCSHK